MDSRAGGDLSSVSIEQILTLSFGKGGNCEGRIGTGWSLGEAGYRWMVGAFSELNIGPVIAGEDYLLILEIEPFVKLPDLPFQTLTLSIDGVPFVQDELRIDGRYGYRIPRELIKSDGDLIIVFDHPDASKPSDMSVDKDHRVLSFLVRRTGLYRVSGASAAPPRECSGEGISIEEAERRTGLPSDALLTQFESLGENCEFGLVQRRCSAEPLSLLRFSNTLLPNLFLGLEDKFKKLGHPEDLTFRLEGKSKKEYIIEEKNYGLVYHTFRYKGEIEEDKFIISEASRLKFLARKLNEDLKDGNKILIYRRNTPLTEEEIIPVLTAVNDHGPNTLFWVVLADRQHKPGSVHWVMPGLLKGYIDRFAPNENAHDLSLEVWMELCANAYQLWQTNKTA
jgi:hypothetical protein